MSKEICVGLRHAFLKITICFAVLPQVVNIDSIRFVQMLSDRCPVAFCTPVTLFTA